VESAEELAAGFNDLDFLARIAFFLGLRRNLIAEEVAPLMRMR